jgi:hypothetical protein
MTTRPIAGGVVVVLALAGVAWFSTNRAPAQAPAAAEAPLPRAADGKPDMSGVWQVLNTASWNIQDHQAEKGVPAGQGVVEGNEIPYLPEALAKKEANYKNRLLADPATKCFQPGVPRIMYMPFPFQIVQTSSSFAFLFEYVHTTRHVRLNSEHPEGPIEWALGDSRARWDGDTLVVDVVHFNAETWFDRAGNHHSDQMHLVERFTMIDRDHINYEITVEDAKVFSRPWKMSMPLYRRIERNVQILDYECQSFDS